MYDLDHRMIDHMSMHFQVISQCSFAVVSFPCYPGHVHGSSMQYVSFVGKNVSACHDCNIILKFNNICLA